MNKEFLNHEENYSYKWGMVDTVYIQKVYASSFMFKSTLKYFTCAYFVVMMGVHFKE